MVRYKQIALMSTQKLYYINAGVICYGYAIGNLLIPTVKKRDDLDVLRTAEFYMAHMPLN